MISRRSLLVCTLAPLAPLAALSCVGPPPAPPPLAPGISWRGGWDTTFGPLVLDQKGGEILGVYKYPNGDHVTTGVLTGRMRGHRLEFAWEEREGGTGRGRGSFEMQPDGDSFVGHWGSRESANDGAEWVGTRLK